MRRGPCALAVLLALGVGAAAWWQARLPALVLDRFHRISARMGEDYVGVAGGVDVDLFARRYRLRDVRVLRRAAGGGDVPLVTADTVVVHVQPLARRSRVVVEGVRLQLIAPQQLGAGVPWRAFLDELAPGTRMTDVEFRDVGVRMSRATERDLVVTLDNLHGALTGLDGDEARLQAVGLLMAHAPLRVEAHFGARGPVHALRLRARAHEVELAKLNAFALRWARIDFHRGEGEFALAVDYAAPRVSGAATASLAGVDVFDLQQDVGAQGLLSTVRELVAGAAVARMKDPDSGRIEREYRIEADVAPSDDPLEGARAVLQAALLDLGRYLP